ncbi:MAG TPA: response regulator transcription factor [Phycisphaerae bacterium]|nr:response regulator transcription factor [Phycisphaerae bacterium]
MPEPPFIMVVEDDMEMNELLRELLALHGMDSAPAYSGAEALELSEQCGINAILLDVMLPEMDGFETCRRLREQETVRSVPIIMLTALDSDECRQIGITAGADAYFIKPFDPDELIDTLRTMMARGH